MTNLLGKVQTLTFGLALLAAPAEAQSIDSMVDAVSDSALFSTIAGLQAFGTRYYNAGNALEVARWLQVQFLSVGLTEVVLDTFTCNQALQANVVATLPGARSPGTEIVVGAHMDSRTLSLESAPGADDDASGTAAVLEIARVLVSSGYRPSTTIRFVHFAAEEPGRVGSWVYTQKAKAAGRKISLMLNFDMIGYTSTADPERHFDIIYYPPDTETWTLVADAAIQHTSLKPVATTTDLGNVDSFSFAMEGYSAVTCIEHLDNPYYHSTGDLLSTLDCSYIRDITRAGLATILLYYATPAAIGPVAHTVPKEFRLEQNWPNPFNPTTTIKYTVGVPSGEWQVAKEAGVGSPEPGARKTRLIVYDVLGRQVAVLVDELKVPGSYEVRFDGSGLSSGLYIYRLSAGSFAQSKKMVLLK